MKGSAMAAYSSQDFLMENLISKFYCIPLDKNKAYLRAAKGTLKGTCTERINAADFILKILLYIFFLFFKGMFRHLHVKKISLM